MKMLPAVLVLVASSAHAQVVRVMTSEMVREAIAYGTSGDASYQPLKDGGVGGLAIGRRRGGGPVFGVWTTPFLRVALAAKKAAKEYKPLTPADVTDELVKPGMLVVYGDSQDVSSGRPLSVRTIVIMPVGADDPARAIQPTKAEPVQKTMGNRLGAKYEVSAMSAEFPLSALVEGNEVRVVYESGPERRAKLKLDGVR